MAQKKTKKVQKKTTRVTALSKRQPGTRPVKKRAVKKARRAPKTLAEAMAPRVPKQRPGEPEPVHKLVRDTNFPPSATVDDVGAGNVTGGYRNRA
jgi:hypothetical protein